MDNKNKDIKSNEKKSDNENVDKKIDEKKSDNEIDETILHNEKIKKDIDSISCDIGCMNGIKSNEDINIGEFGKYKKFITGSNK